jgi:peptidoglycan/LPS O-acetylase OafA/YrhL
VTESNRLHYLDNLRALAMMMGVLFHAALAYSPLMHNFWLTADRGRSVWVDVAAWFLHLFRMPLFFAIAGFFAARLVERRGVGGMLRNRMARVLLPLVVFWPLVTVSIGWLVQRALSSVRHAPPLLEMLRRGELPALPPSLAHLWFLGYLLLFYLLIWMAATGEWKAPEGWARAATPGRLLLLGPLLLAPALASVGAPTPAPEGVLPQLWALVFYGAFFLFGYAMHREGALLEGMRPFAAAMGLGSLVAHAGFLWLLKEQSRFGAHVLAAVLEASISVWMTAWCLLAGREWLQAHRGWLRYLSDGSYWTYLVHLPVVFAIQFALLDWEAGWVVKWAVSVAGTLVVCLGSYQLAVRGTAVGRLLNGSGVRRTG